jgi:hypothetical protein
MLQASRVSEFTAVMLIECGETFSRASDSSRGAVLSDRSPKGTMIVNICPTATTNAPLEAVWHVLVDTQHYGDWIDAEVVSVDPRGPACSGQRIELASRALGRRWHASIEIGRMDHDRRWIEMVARTPFGVVNREHVTLTAVDGGRTLVRFN